MIYESEKKSFLSSLRRILGIFRSFLNAVKGIALCRHGKWGVCSCTEKGRTKIKTSWISYFGPVCPGLSLVHVESRVWALKLRCRVWTWVVIGEPQPGKWRNEWDFLLDCIGGFDERRQDICCFTFFLDPSVELESFSQMYLKAASDGWAGMPSLCYPAWHVVYAWRVPWSSKQSSTNSCHWFTNHKPSSSSKDKNESFSFCVLKPWCFMLSTHWQQVGETRSQNCCSAQRLRPEKMENNWSNSVPSLFIIMTYLIRNGNTYNMIVNCFLSSTVFVCKCILCFIKCIFTVKMIFHSFNQPISYTNWFIEWH